jgi:uncharacterized OB-fold protein
MSLLPTALQTKIPIRVCPTCSYVDRHPIRWCSNCGAEYEIVLMTESEYRKRSITINKEIWDRGYTGVSKETI